MIRDYDVFFVVQEIVLITSPRNLGQRINCDNNSRDQNTRNLVDPARGDRFWSSIKPCESRALGARHTAQ